MLYFSKVGVDPDKIDLHQIEKLKSFKEKTYPKGLVESYKTHLEFRDKFTKQLEIKIRELERSESSGEAPISLQFVSIETEELIGDQAEHASTVLCVDKKIVQQEHLSKEQLEKLDGLVGKAIKARCSFPIALAIQNLVPSGIRNIYIEVVVSSTFAQMDVLESPFKDSGDGRHWTLFPIREKSLLKLTKFGGDGGLQKIESGWQFSFGWDALQPRRVRIIKPILFVFSSESCDICFTVKIFADSFVEPLILTANLSVGVTKVDVELSKLMPDWRIRLQDEDESPVFRVSRGLLDAPFHKSNDRLAKRKPKDGSK